MSDVSTLVALTNLQELRLANNPALTCQSAAVLVTQLGSPPVSLDADLNTKDSVNPGVNCV